jgi:hypothetical protein
MPVSPTVRRVEREIDEAVRSHQLFRVQRDRLILALLDCYRDAIELVFLTMAHGRQFGVEGRAAAGIALESQLHLGLLQSLKWAMEFATTDSDSFSFDHYEIDELARCVGPAYVNFADALKMAKYDQSSIQVEESTRTITVYEGGDLTGADAQLVSYQHETLPFRTHMSFVEDGDQLTTRWTAGDFRRLTESLRLIAAEAEKETIVSTFGGGTTPLFQRPVLLEVPDVEYVAQEAALQDLTLTREKLQGSEKWGLSSWLDMPFVMIGPKRMGVSNLIKTLAGTAREDTMLRVAAGRDPGQYSKVSGVREGRMITFCKPILESNRWNVTPDLRLRNPDQQIDVFAERGECKQVIQLKSTLRPESPWEVLERNEDVIDGIIHTSDILKRFPAGARGFVLTDGYRGDYQTWKVALDRGVMTGTMEDIEVIAAEPSRAAGVLKQRAGFGRACEVTSIPDREQDLFGWKLRLVDAPHP